MRIKNKNKTLNNKLFTEAKFEGFDSNLLEKSKEVDGSGEGIRTFTGPARRVDDEAKIFRRTLRLQYHQQQQKRRLWLHELYPRNA